MPHLTEVPLQAVALEAEEFLIKDKDQVIQEALTKVAHAEAAVAEALVQLVHMPLAHQVPQEELEQHLQ